MDFVLLVIMTPVPIILGFLGYFIVPWCCAIPVVQVLFFFRTSIRPLEAMVNEPIYAILECESMSMPYETICTPRVADFVERTLQIKTTTSLYLRAFFLKFKGAYTPPVTSTI